jgi:type IV secretion system protein VirB1
MLQATGWDFSVGLAQINVRNLRRLGLTLETAFEPCANLAAMQSVLSECFVRAGKQGLAPQRSLRQALSCYYSGNFTTGFKHGYVRRVIDAAAGPSTGEASILITKKESS